MKSDKRDEVIIDSVGDFKSNMHYVITNSSVDKMYLKGDRFLLEIRKEKEFHDDSVERIRYVTFGPPKSNVKFGPLTQLNTVRYFNSKKEFLNAVKGMEVKSDIEWAMKRINKLEQELDTLSKNYCVKVKKCSICGNPCICGILT
jgi:hypothetical protein